MKKKTVFAAALLFSVLFAFPQGVYGAAKLTTVDTGMTGKVYAEGFYSNWEGVSNVSQFSDEDGNYYFAFDNGKKVTVAKTKNGKVTKKIELTKKHPLFGAVETDSDGNFYLVTGEANNGNDTSKETVFISKYDGKGKHIKTVGDNGSSSLASYYDESFYTKIPFDGGNCDIAVNGDYVSINYAREMYSGHQSNSVWIVDRNTMKTVKPEREPFDPENIPLSEWTQNEDGSYTYYWNGSEEYQIYSSHSFGQRAIPFGNGFLYMSEGDSYNRAFTLTSLDMESGDTKEDDIFHFWVKAGAHDAYDMFVLNNNFATIGDLCDIGGGRASFVATSVRNLDSKATKQNQQLFIQVFDPHADLSGASGFSTSGTRSGKGGNNGTDSVKDFGVKFLTSYSDKTIANPQAVSDGNGKTIILFELYNSGYSYDGLYYCVCNKEGKLTTKIKKLSDKAYLNSCETPVYSNGKVYWTANMAGSDAIYDMVLTL